MIASSQAAPRAANSHRLCAIEVEHDDIVLNQAVEREQSIAIADLLESNCFELVGQRGGPYRLTLSTRGSRLALHIATRDEVFVSSHIISFTPLKRIIRDYVTICETHFRAAAEFDRYRLETVDMARRAIHDEGSELLKERLSGRVNIDQDTARRLFTIIVAPFTVGIFG
ncbi:uncharacterized protein (UPF0262 family) [Mycoplana sp. BE70]|uniref:UPF0262 family protein n=1 Tax=Mycoplana sp. BE70 TaxID=2817775 RepID=UPI0028630C2C|nr:UPF0262 family protein [Mycoplana sp. BE70]MDR6758771.1 uncharacterized protein (UPF0262 family) [Mycoplana sp. BE70]